MYYVYILKCPDKTYYTGCTHDLEDRMKRHNLGQIHYTKTRLPVKLHSYVAFSDKYKAYDFERYLKSGNKRLFTDKF